MKAFPDKVNTRPVEACRVFSREILQKGIGYGRVIRAAKAYAKEFENVSDGFRGQKLETWLEGGTWTNFDEPLEHGDGRMVRRAAAWLTAYRTKSAMALAEQRVPNGTPGLWSLTKDVLEAEPEAVQYMVDNAPGFSELARISGRTLASHGMVPMMGTETATKTDSE